MRSSSIPRASVAVVLGLAAGCGPSDRLPDVPVPRPLEVPAGAGAAQPFASRGDGVVLVSWIEPAASGHSLRFSSWDGQQWAAPRTVAEGADWFVNWADFPSIVQAGDVLAAHWLQRSGPGRYSYDVLLTQSVDGGSTWSPPVRPHGDETPTEHGFVSLFPHDGAVAAVWLDGREFAGTEHGGPPARDMQVRTTTVAADGTLSAEVLLDGRACDCCQTAVALTSQGPVVAYRDRSPDEVRDIAVTRLVDGAWTEPRVLHADNWVIGGCPVNGPAADADGAHVAVAWFTAADPEPRVQVAFSEDAGATFGTPARVDDGDPIGRVDLLMLTPELALVVWLETVGGEAELRARLVDRQGRSGGSRTVAATSGERASGFPRMARLGSDVLLVWTQHGDPSVVRAAVLPFDL